MQKTDTVDPVAFGEMTEYTISITNVCKEPSISATSGTLECTFVTITKDKKCVAA
ncbi:hypothetical protein G7047_10960 [Diaphorobacter sp. HDW4A]|uniref:hypothetical protein n=1 Tax=Diaphorobacter sp. HDW4A TaxID=2714924 RepID=UPI001408E586|nr:hypothetical protein [Diaphorobacter sp. HDW4A]QIL80362.1 hypothetical protein G7047_10960 [Diaphorobacter sp. HDW4A]